jgi:hypothetical protein
MKSLVFDRHKRNVLPMALFALSVVLCPLGVLIMMISLFWVVVAFNIAFPSNPFRSTTRKFLYGE